MNLSNLKPAKGSVQSPGKRVGRGQGSGKGGTATRGHKGAKSRSGYSRKIGFEGVKCQFKDVYQNLALITSTEKVTKVSIWTPSKIWWIQKKLNQLWILTRS